ncbi:MAG: hypothetical protein GX456_02840 [Verrucomicrobia bacterium]|nr:hypothetical protein [Verrucomicrobiota bacterium]
MRSKTKSLWTFNAEADIFIHDVFNGRSAAGLRIHYVVRTDSLLTPPTGLKFEIYSN